MLLTLIPPPWNRGTWRLRALGMVRAQKKRKLHYVWHYGHKIFCRAKDGRKTKQRLMELRAMRSKWTSSLWAKQVGSLRKEFGLRSQVRPRSGDTEGAPEEQQQQQNNNNNNNNNKTITTRTATTTTTRTRTRTRRTRTTIIIITCHYDCHHFIIVIIVVIVIILNCYCNYFIFDHLHQQQQTQHTQQHIQEWQQQQQLPNQQH